MSQDALSCTVKAGLVASALYELELALGAKWRDVDEQDAWNLKHYITILGQQSKLRGVPDEDRIQAIESTIKDALATARSIVEEHLSDWHSAKLDLAGVSLKS